MQVAPHLVVTPKRGLKVALDLVGTLDHAVVLLDAITQAVVRRFENATHDPMNPMSAVNAQDASTEKSTNSLTSFQIFFCKADRSGAHSAVRPHEGKEEQ